MSAQFIISIDDQIAELKAELALRERVFRKWIIAGKMTEESGARRMARMRAALRTLIEVKEKGYHELERERQVEGFLT